MTFHIPSPERTNDLAEQAAPLANDAGTLAERGADAVRAGFREARDNAQHASGSIKRGPIKSLVIAGAAGAALIALARLIVRQRIGSRTAPSE